ncbi:MAG: hypothetical protein EBS73_14625 [Betaproteobacteria bacterium]|jgi:hypothetical protein|nr:hypothetical protein [Betaproteobacteria bacterium]
MDFAEAVSLEINKQIRYAEEQLSQGSMKSFEDYKFVCGQIQGLLIARRINEDLANRIRDDND